jgi:hypothetical protein
MNDNDTALRVIEAVRRDDTGISYFLSNLAPSDLDRLHNSWHHLVVV